MGVLAYLEKAVAKIRSRYREPMIVAWLGDREVGPDEVVTVPDEHVPNYLGARLPEAPTEPAWELVDEPKPARSAKVTKEAEL